MKAKTMQINTLLTISALALAGCAAVAVKPMATGIDPDAMEYQAERDDVWRTDMPARGDCEDYALGWSRKLGGTGVLVATTYNGQDHMVLLRGGKVYDVNHTVKPGDLKGAVACDVDTGKVAFLNNELYVVPFTPQVQASLKAQPGLPGSMARKCEDVSRELRTK